MALVKTSAQSRVEQYLAASAKSKALTRPEAYEGETKSHYAWRLLRTSLKSATEIVKRSDLKKVVITHGLVHVRKLNHPRVITEVLYNKNTKEYVTLDGSTARVFDIDGRLKSFLQHNETFNRLLCATHVSLYVGWTAESNSLLLLDASFAKRYVTTAPGPILAATYNENIGEVVAVGPGYIASWVFRYGGRCILPRKVTTDGLSPDNDRFSIIALEDTASRAQRAFVTNDRSVAVFNLYAGTLLSYKRYLHDRCITALLFYNQLKYLITAAKDGTIKLWDENWNLQVIFIGHLGAILSLSVYPYGSKIMTVGDDKTIRTWSLETCDEVENIEVTEGTHSLGVVVNLDDIFSVAETHVDLWKFNHVHLLHTRVGEPVFKVRSTTHPDVPVRCVADCVDSSVRILCPNSGEVITTLLGTSDRGLVASAYAIAEDTLFVSYEDGTIIKADTCVNPSAVVEQWKCPDPQKAATCLAVYEFIVRVSSGADSYAGAAKRTEVLKGLPGGSAGRYKSRTQSNRTLLLGALRSGQLCVYNWDSGAMDLVVKAHDSQGICSLSLNIREDQLITVGNDRMIKVWRVYPYARDTLALLLSLHVAGPPTQMTIASRWLTVAFEDMEMASFPVVMFNLKTKERYDHPPIDDHLQTITGLTSCPKMKLFASSSKDGTVRIWNNRNRLLRVIQLQTIAKSICFCSSKGDLLLAVGDHVHRIDYLSYMPRSYLLKMAATSFPEPVHEKAIPFSVEALSGMSHNDIKRLKSARSAFRFTHFVDILTREEAQELLREKREREKAYAKLETREKDLRFIRDGGFPTARKSKSTPETKQEAFENYFKMFLDRPKIEALPSEEIVVELDEVEEKNDAFVPEKEPSGFFPPPKRTRPPSSSAIQKPAAGRVLPPIDGFIPNSVLVKLLFPEKVEEVEEEVEEVHERPLVQIDDPERMERIRLLMKKAHGSRSSSVSFDDQVQILDYADDDEDGDWKLAVEKPHHRKQSDDSIARNKLMDILQKSSTLSSVVTDDDDDDTTLQDYSVKKPLTPFTIRLTTSPELDVMVDGQLPGKPLEDKERSEGTKTNLESLLGSVTKSSRSGLVEVSPPTGAKFPVGKAPAREEEDEEESVRKSQSPSILPDYLHLFRGRDWFDKHFPKSQLENLAKPWSLEEFVSMLSRLIRISDFPLRTKVTNALIELNRFYNMTNTSDVYSAIYAVLGDQKIAPCYEKREDVAFLEAALKLMHALGIHDFDFYQELMVMYLAGDDGLKQLVINSLEGVGLRDATQEFPRELESWDAWSIEGANRNARLRSACADWLTKWMTMFKNHVRDSAERLQRGHGVHGQVQQEQVKGLMSKKSSEHIVKSAPGSGVISVTLLPGSGFASAASSRATYLDAINYFCEMAMHKHLLTKEKARTSTEDVQAFNKNTIVSLPRPCGKGPLVRIGDTHSSKCHQKRETAYQVDFPMPAFNYINLPLKKINMYPFPRSEDQKDLLYDQQPILLLLKTAQKYFIPSRSFIAQQS